MTKSIAIIGAGYMAEEHIKAFNCIPEIKISGITSKTLSRAQILAETYDIGIVSKDIPSLFNETKADGVVIAVNELSTLEIVRECMQYSWSILCEKPLGLYLADTISIANEASINDTNIFLAMNRRHYSSTTKSLNLLKEDIGKRFVEVHDQENIIGAIKGGQHPEVVARWMIANSIHLIDYFSIFCRGDLTDIGSTIELESVNSFVMQKTLNFNSGDIGVYTAVWNAPGPWGVRITTRSQMLEMRPLECLDHQIFPQKRKEAIQLSEPDEKLKPGLYVQSQEFINHINHKKHSLPSLEDYIHTVNIVEKLYPQSLKKIM